MQEPLTELAAHFRHAPGLLDEDVLHLVAAARAGGCQWGSIARACGAANGQDPGGSGADADWLFGGLQRAAGRLAGAGPAAAWLTWPCPACGRQVTDLAPSGRPVHTQLGHRQGCGRLARDQAGDDASRRVRLPRLAGESQPARGRLQRHWLTRRITDDCPRCGWHGHFDTWAATISGDWSRVICDNCYADLSPDITVGVTYFAVSDDFTRQKTDGMPFGVIRQRARSDEKYPDLGQILTWQLLWQWTPILVQEARDGADCDVTRVSRADAEKIIVFLARRHWPSEAARLPWIENAYPK